MEWLYVICFVVAIGSFIFSFSLTKKEKTVAMIIALVAFILGFVFVGIYVSMNGGGSKGSSGNKYQSGLDYYEENKGLIDWVDRVD